MNNKKLYRVEQGKIISGVCGGIAEFFDLDPSLIRVAAVVLDILTGVFPMAIGYIVVAAILPKK